MIFHSFNKYPVHADLVQNIVGDKNAFKTYEQNIPKAASLTLYWSDSLQLLDL